MERGCVRGAYNILFCRQNSLPRNKAGDNLCCRAKNSLDVCLMVLGCRRNRYGPDTAAIGAWVAETRGIQYED